MLLTIVAIWAIVIPLLVVGVASKVAKPLQTEGSLIVSQPVSKHHRATPGGDAAPRCAIPAARPRRTITRRVCPEHPRGRRPASA